MEPVSTDLSHGLLSANGTSLQHIEDLLLQMTDVSNSSLAEAQHRKETLYRHRMMPALFDVLCELKIELIVPQQLAKESDTGSTEHDRLDNILVAEGIVRPSCYTVPNSVRIMDSSYKRQVSNIKKLYHQELKLCEQFNDNFMTHVTHLVRDHSRSRPITAMQLACFDSIIRQKCASSEIYLKQWTCERLMFLRSSFLDHRRKRRNFTKTTLDVLNEYFFSHLKKPYPTEVMKKKLAVQCGLSVTQVSNWFGNKRIRYKRSVAKDSKLATPNVNDYDRNVGMSRSPNSEGGREETEQV